MNRPGVFSPVKELKSCISLASTYHLNKKLGTSARWDMVEKSHKTFHRKSFTLRFKVSGVLYVGRDHNLALHRFREIKVRGYHEYK
jgi:hypothetical protein